MIHAKRWRQPSRGVLAPAECVCDIARAIENPLSPPGRGRTGSVMWSLWLSDRFRMLITAREIALQSFDDTGDGEVVLDAGGGPFGVEHPLGVGGSRPAQASGESPRTTMPGLCRPLSARSLPGACSWATTGSSARMASLTKRPVPGGEPAERGDGGVGRGEKRAHVGVRACMDDEIGNARGSRGTVDGVGVATGDDESHLSTGHGRRRERGRGWA